MNTSFDLDNPEDFVEMCGNGNICPHKPIDIRNISNLSMKGFLPLSAGKDLYVCFEILP